MPLLSLQAVEASYGAIRALRGVTIDVEQGSIVTLLGANGAGKSTTLKTISGMMKVSSGSISYEGQSISGRTPNQLVKMGIAQVPLFLKDGITKLSLNPGMLLLLYLVYTLAIRWIIIFHL